MSAKLLPGISVLIGFFCPDAVVRLRLFTPYWWSIGGWSGGSRSGHGECGVPWASGRGSLPHQPKGRVTWLNANKKAIARPRSRRRKRSSPSQQHPVKRVALRRVGSRTSNQARRNSPTTTRVGGPLYCSVGLGGCAVRGDGHEEIPRSCWRCLGLGAGNKIRSCSCPKSFQPEPTLPDTCILLGKPIAF
jgi:hypothetical protein